MKRLYTQEPIEPVELELCNDCPHMDATSVDCKVVIAHCEKANKNHPALGKDGIELMCMEIPDWCPLPNV